MPSLNTAPRRINGGKSAPISLPATAENQELLVDAIDRFNSTLSATNEHLASLATDTSSIAGFFGSFKRFSTRYLPYIVGAAGVLYPPLSKWFATIAANLPPLGQ